MRKKIDQLRLHVRRWGAGARANLSNRASELWNGEVITVRSGHIVRRTATVEGARAYVLAGTAVSPKGRYPSGANIAVDFGGEDQTEKTIEVRRKKDGGAPFEILIITPPKAEIMHVSFRLLEGVRLAHFSNFTVSPLGDLKDPRFRTLIDDSALRQLAHMAFQRGELSSQLEYLISGYSRFGREEFASGANLVKGLLKELDVSWTPNIVLPCNSTKNREVICHLHKVAIIYENSGGAVRNASIVEGQHKAGLRPFVMLPLCYPGRAAIKGQQGKGYALGIHEVSRNGVPYLHITPRANKGKIPVPSDVSLQVDAQFSAEVIAKKSPALLHAASGFRGYELALKAIPIARQLKIPLVYEVRSLHEHLWGPNSRLSDEFTQLRVAQENKCMLAASAVVTISESMRRLLIDRGIDESKILVVPNAVEPRFLAPLGEATSAKMTVGLDGFRTIGYISNFSDREGHPVLIRAVANLLRQGVDVRCLLVGDGPTRKHCEELCDRLGIRQFVKFVGEVSHEEVISYYRAIDVFVVPRIADYAADYVTPLKPFEAMALRVPLIMSDRPVSYEIVGNNERGLLFKTGDVDDLTQKIKMHLENIDSTENFVRNAHSWVKKNRNWSENINRYTLLYEKLLK